MIELSESFATVYVAQLPENSLITMADLLRDLLEQHYGTKQ
ncbi:hypothetical protein [Nostoc foliaceum]|nr:hypothetical protein [Nostoc foliaceum]